MPFVIPKAIWGLVALEAMWLITPISLKAAIQRVWFPVVYLGCCRETLRYRMLEVSRGTENMSSPILPLTQTWTLQLQVILKTIEALWEFAVSDYVLWNSSFQIIPFTLQNLLHPGRAQRKGLSSSSWCILECWSNSLAVEKQARLVKALGGQQMELPQA